MKAKLAVHQFAHDGESPDFDGHRYCRCGARDTHPRHDMPDTPAEVLAHEARVLGEHLEDE